MKKDMENILARHRARYPKMALQDAVKLFYQQCFGPGHMAEMPKARQAIEAECQSLAPASSALLEDIGGGLCRMYLDSPDFRPMDPALAAGLFVRTAEEAPSQSPAFSAALSLLESQAAGGLWGPSGEALAFLEQYRAQGCPSLHHSEAYRAAYHPHYRVIRRQLAEYLPALRFLQALSAGGKRAVVAIDGRCGSGKTTLASLASACLPCTVFHMDDFFLPPQLRTPQRLAQPGENVHHERFLSEVLLPLSQGRQVVYQPFSCRTGALQPPVCCQPKPLVIVEGSYSMHPSLLPYYTHTLVLQISPDEQRRRLLLREGKEGFSAFAGRWIPLEEEYFSKYKLAELSSFTLTF